MLKIGYGTNSFPRSKEEPPLNPLLSKEGTSAAQGWWIKQ
jgi:hypothetical protein